MRILRPLSLSVTHLEGGAVTEPVYAGSLSP